jgi:hypothetical protein
MQDKDGHAVIVALEPISKDDEVLLFFFLFVKSSLSSYQEKALTNNELSRLPYPTLMKIFHMRRGRRNLRIMVSHVRVQSAKKSSRTERRDKLVLKFCWPFHQTLL